MATPPKVERNKRLVELRRRSPNKYSFKKLGEIFGIKRETAHNIFKREVARR